MSTLRVTAEQLVVRPHPNADRLELAQVGLYNAVVAKGEFRTGDWAVYIPEKAVLPPDLIEELGLTGKLAGPQHDRVKAVRLRGELSQGIVCLPHAVTDVVTSLAEAAAKDADFADLLGIVKYVPPIPTTMGGDVESGVDMLPWVDIQNLKRYPTVFRPGELVHVTEKVHGTCCVVTYHAAAGQVQVTSKGLGEQKLALKMPDPVTDNLYWRTVVAYDVPEVLERLADRMGADRIGLYAEVYGQGVQDLHYGVPEVSKGTPGFRVFDMQIEVAGQTRWLSYHDIRSELADGPGADAETVLPMVPLLMEGPYDQATILKLASGRETLSGRAEHIREGVVVRAQVDRYSEVLGDRAIVKVVSEEYELRDGGTEYE